MTPECTLCVPTISPPLSFINGVRSPVTMPLCSSLWPSVCTIHQKRQAYWPSFILCYLLCFREFTLAFTILPILWEGLCWAHSAFGSRTGSFFAAGFQQVLWL